MNEKFEVHAIITIEAKNRSDAEERVANALGECIGYYWDWAEITTVKEARD